LRSSYNRSPSFGAPAGAFRRLPLFPVSGGASAYAVAAPASSPFAILTQGLLPLPQRQRSLSQNAPLWALVSLFTAFTLLWGSTYGQLIAPETALAPLMPVADTATSAAALLRHTATAFPAAPSVILARLRPGAGQPWTLVEVDGKTVRVSDPARVEAALAAAGFTLDSGDRVITIPNTGKQLVQRAVPFSLIDGGVPFTQRAAAGTVGEALAAIGVDINTADLVTPPQESPLVPGLRVSVLRAQPVAITAPDVQLEVRSRAATVGDLLSENAIPLGPLDRVEPALEAPLPIFGTVNVVRVREEERQETRIIPFQTRTQLSDDLLPGTRIRTRAGVNGLVERLVRIVFENDVEVNRVSLVERMLRETVDEVFVAARPVAPTLNLPGLPGVPALPGPILPAPPIPNLPVRSVVTMVATAYDPGPASTGKYPGHPAYGITATGMRAAVGIVAVDPRVIPFYTRLYIPGYGYAIAGDTGGDIKGNRIDVFYPTYGEAIQWGRRVVPVYILE
jgi:3D (Asp-Asp-Asp) domain-containing protein/uncharacterized protein YabE (DUF348 family)